MTILQRIAADFSSSPRPLPLLRRDPVLNAGSKLLFDPRYPYCRNSNATGTITGGMIFKNLVAGGPDILPNGSGNPPTLNAAGEGVTFAGVAANGMNLIGGNTYSLHAGDKDFLAVVWCKIPATVTGSANVQLMGLRADTSNSMFYIDNGGDQKTPRFVVNNHSNSPTPAGIPGFTADAVHQLGVAKYGDNALVFLDGVLVVQGFMNDLPLADMSANNLNIGSSRITGRIYRAYLEDLTTSGADPFEQAALDWRANETKFS